MPINFFVNFICRLVGVNHNNTTRNTSYQLLVVFIQQFEVLERDARVTRLVPFLNVLECNFWILGQVDEELRPPSKFVPKIIINFILLRGDVALVDEDFPKHIS